MNPRNPYFYVATFAPGPLPAGGDLNTLVTSMNDACYGPMFQPDRCAVLSQMVGRVRQQDACAKSPVTAGSSLAVSGAAMAAPKPVATETLTNPSASTVAAALRTVGSQPKSGGGLALCG